MDITGWLPYVVAGWVFLSGCYGLATSRNLVHAVVCLAVAQSATYLLLLAVGWTRGGTAPIFSDISRGRRVADPVVQAMTLTDVVVGVAVSALLFALTIQVARRSGTIDPAELRGAGERGGQGQDRASETEEPETERSA